VVTPFVFKWGGGGESHACLKSGRGVVVKWGWLAVDEVLVGEECGGGAGGWMLRFC